MKTITHLRILYTGRTPRTFTLPIPFASLSEKRGTVLCDPEGIFPVEDGRALLDLVGEGGPFKLIEEIEGEDNEDSEESVLEQPDEIKTPRKQILKKRRGRYKKRMGLKFKHDTVSEEESIEQPSPA